MREPPVEHERRLREAFPECRYEWMHRANMWRVVRVVPSEDLDRMAREGKITAEDVDAYRATRAMDGYRDGEQVVIHAFTLRDPETGDPAEPGDWVIDALRLADSHSFPGGPREAAKKVLAMERERRERLEREQTEAIQTIVNDADRANEVIYSYAGRSIDGKDEKKCDL